MNFIKDENGIAYVIITIFVGLIVGALLFMTFQEVIVTLVDNFNTQVLAGGVVTENSVNTVDTLLMLFTLAVPFFILVAIAEYAIVKAIEKKTTRRF